MGIYIFVSVLIIIACALQVMIVLIQNSKGGGLANFTSAGQSLGIRKTADFLEKSTWTIAISIFVLSLIATAAIPRGGELQRSRLENQIQNAIDPNAIPTLPTATPPSAGTSQQNPQEN